jgi:predicted Zn-ribbon and HTH transcriptional regulator
MYFNKATRNVSWLFAFMECIILVDVDYGRRFWCLLEAYLAMHFMTSRGMKMTNGASVHHVTRVLGLSGGEQALADVLITVLNLEESEFLKKLQFDDIQVCVQRDKEIMIPNMVHFFWHCRHLAEDAMRSAPASRSNMFMAPLINNPSLTVDAKGRELKEHKAIVDLRDISLVAQQTHRHMSPIANTPATEEQDIDLLLDEEATGLSGKEISRLSNSSANREDDWESAYSHGKQYWFNRATGQAQWEKPPACKGCGEVYRPLHATFCGSCGKKRDQAAPSNWQRQLLATADVVASAFDGDWDKAVIQGNTITWRDGTTNRLERVSPTEVRLLFDSRSFLGTLRDGRLHWSDGDTWTKVHPGGDLDLDGLIDGVEKKRKETRTSRWV